MGTASGAEAYPRNGSQNMLPLPSRADPHQFDALIASARARTPTPKEVASLAHRLAESGEQLTMQVGATTADLASTGGPGSLSTLLVPLVLVASGYRVPKLGVAGRPSGAIDALGTLPGYRTRLGRDEAAQVLASCGYVHCLADERFAPLDAELFAYRRRVGATNIPPLAIASLLAKKLAFGVQHVGLDVRVFTGGNFGDTRAAARRAAELFVQTAQELSITAVCILHEGVQSWQPHLGRGESLMALHEVLTDRALGWLAKHSTLCFEMAGCMIGSELPTTAALRHAFEQHLTAQGSSWEGFEARVAAIAGAPRVGLQARQTGILQIDLAQLRDAIVRAQGENGLLTFSDRAGLSLTTYPGKMAESGALLADVRFSGDLAEGSAFEAAASEAFSVTTMPSEPSEEYIEIVH